MRRTYIDNDGDKRFNDCGEPVTTCTCERIAQGHMLPDGAPFTEWRNEWPEAYDLGTTFIGQSWRDVHLGAPESIHTFTPQKILGGWVSGRPAPKGSLKNVAKRGEKPRLQEDNPHSAPWRKTIASHFGLMTNWGRDLGWPLAIPVAIAAVFYFERPPGNDSPVPTREVGDLDKLLRNVGDALKDAGVYRDDSQVYRYVGDPRKVWCRPDDGRGPGARIEIWEADLEGEY